MIWSALRVRAADFQPFIQEAVAVVETLGELVLVLDRRNRVAIVRDYRKRMDAQDQQAAIVDCTATGISPDTLSRQSHAWACYGRQIEGRGDSTKLHAVPRRDRIQRACNRRYDNDRARGHSCKVAMQRSCVTMDAAIQFLEDHP